MSTFTKYEIVAQMIKTGVVPVFYHSDLEVAKAVLKASYDAGIRVFEFTNSGDNAYEVFFHLKKYAVSKLPGLALGIGTIITTHETRKFIQGQADFLVSPVFKKEVANECNKAFKLYIPGCATATEILNAIEAGAVLVKLFPAVVIGPHFVSNLLAALPDLNLIATGGIETSDQSLNQWFNSGIKCLGLGSELLDKKLVENKDYDAIQNKIATILSIIKMIKSQ